MNLIIYSFLVTFVLLFIIFYLIYLYYQRSFEYWSSRNVFQLKPSFPFGNFNSKILTQSGANIQDIYNELRKTGEQYGGYHMLAMPFFMPLTPELYKEVFVKNFECFHDHGMYHDEEKDPMSAHIVALEGQNWKFIRSKLSPAFNSIKLKMMFPIMKKCSTDVSDIIQNAEKIEIYDLATRYTTDIICSCAFGIEENSLKNPGSEFRENGKKLIVHLSLFDSMRFAFGIMAPQILRKFNICFFDPKLTKFFYHIVKKTINYRENNNVKRNDFMDSLINLMNNKDIETETDFRSSTDKINDRETLTLNQIAAQVFFFYIAGFETSAMAITFCMYELAKHPDIQQKVREEILNVLEENNGEMTYEAINNMPYTDKVIYGKSWLRFDRFSNFKRCYDTGYDLASIAMTLMYNTCDEFIESMRKNPPIVMLNRIVTKPYRVPGSALTLEEGTRVVISTLGVHHDPAFYPEPDRFDPERFSEEEKAKRPPMTYFPFGEGPRICLGVKFSMVEIKLALIVLLKNFKYSVHQSTPPQIRTKSNGNILGLKDKIWLTRIKV